MTSMTTSTTFWRRKARYKLLALACASSLAGCSGLSQTDMESSYRALDNMWSGGRPVARAEVDRIREPAIGLQIGLNAEVVLTLASESSGTRYWTSPLHLSLSTHDGRVTGTGGLSDNVTISEMPSAAAEEAAAPVRMIEADFPELGLYSVRIVCERRPAGEETIVILDKPLRTLKAEEDCSSQSAKLEWSFRNLYWTDPQSGLVWRSVQYVNPRLAPLKIEILRPPA